ncbi:CBO0543 family protein [Alkalihalobacillus sp. BA299]|uniref:CBO0543 family protein n=1 Tax=Alkalihalobacillus sp. BA299 TaxID=2815938 RepID=UPI002468262C|nr:CBO0543 family protein [Alkalihalobacillus sp. BA299]
MKNYKLEKSIIFSSSFIIIFLLILYVPKQKVRQAFVSFLFHQVITWFFGLLVVEKGLIKYPYRYFFKHSNKSSFLFEYLIFPAIAVLFNLYFPKKSNKGRIILYYFLYTSIITSFEMIAVKYTKLIRYKKWAWYWSFVTIWTSYYLSHLFYKWFFKKTPKCNIA